MAEQVQQNNGELDSIALEIFSSMPRYSGRSAEQDALHAYQRAEAFAKVKQQVRGGLLKQKAETPVLADCHAKNLKRTHPLNLVSQAMGDLAKVKRLNKWLFDNPTPENDPEDLEIRLNTEFPDLGWKMPEINTARAVFPVYAGKN